MKKLIAVLLVSVTALFATNASAHGWGRAGWFAAGVGVGYIATRPYYGPHYYGYYYPPAPVYYTPPPVVYTPPPVYVQQPYPANQYHQEVILDSNCNCYRNVWVQN